MPLAKREAGEQWNCAACQQLLVGATTVNDRVAPIEVAVNPNGNCILFRRFGEIRVATVPPDKMDWVKEQGFELRRNHFQGCPKAERFRPQTPSSREESDRPEGYLRA